MSGDFLAFMNYMVTWDSESDENIDSILDEHSLFKQLDNYNADKSVKEEFETLKDLAIEVRDNTIASDAIKISADAAAVSAIWSFGLGMAAFAALEAAAVIEDKVISNKSIELNTKLQTVDTDIAAKAGSTVEAYVKSYKKNNVTINAKAPRGLDQRTCRSILMQFLGQVERRTKLDADTFRRYAASARVVLNSDQIKLISNGLDSLNLSDDKSDEDITKFINTLKGSFDGGAIDREAVTLTYVVSTNILSNRMGIANEKIKEIAKERQVPVEEVDMTAFETMDAVGKLSAAVAVVMGVVDVVFDVLDIVDVVEQTKKMVEKLDGPIKESYLEYFAGIGRASHQYNQALDSAPTSASG